MVGSEVGSGGSVLAPLGRKTPCGNGDGEELDLALASEDSGWEEEAMATMRLSEGKYD